MNWLNLPKNWISIVSAPRWTKPYGWYDRGRKALYVYPPKWIPPWFGLRKVFEVIIYNHEALHAWGNSGCKKPWCLGYEGPKCIEYLSMPVQLLNGLRFCKKCMGFYKGGDRK